MHRRLFLLVALAFALSGCGGTIPAADPLGSEGDFRRGERLLEQKRYLQAIEALDAFRNDHPGSDRIDDAIFLLGVAHQKSGEHLLARDEFVRLLRDFPQSEHREEAQFEVAMSWMAEVRGPALDPEPIEEALKAFRTYLRLYPEGKYAARSEENITRCRDRLAVKAYQNGLTYLRLKAGEAARIYFEKSLAELPESSCAADALLGLARAHELRADPEAARSTYRSVIEFVTPERVAARKSLARARREAEEALARLETTSRENP